MTAYFPGALLSLFGLFLAFQTATLRFTFDDYAFSLVRSDLSSTGEKCIVETAREMYSRDRHPPLHI